ncbi:MAG: hypothetical protein KC636_12255 [Myxococcales bacterium]|nr:hypothetical protein [Myxococcales bacterium]
MLFEAERVQLLVKDPTDDVLKAQLPPWTEHPRALLTILEGLSLWSGGRLCAAAYVDERATDCFEQIFYAGGLVEPASPLVTVDVCPRRDRPRRLGGIGDFRQLRLREVGR